MEWIRKPELDHNLAAKLLNRIHWRETIILAAIMIPLLVIEVRAAAHRSLWFDEFSTLAVSSAPTIKGMFQVLFADGNPPLFFFLARFCRQFPISIEVALRLPSIIAIDFTALMIYLFVRRNTGSIFAFLAMGVFLSSNFVIYAVLEGRPYGLLLCFTSISICCWQSATRGKKRYLALAGIAAGMAGAIFTHHYGVIYVTIPLATGECVRAWQRRRIDFPVLLSMMFGATALFITFPPMLRGQAGLLKAVKLCPDFWARPSLQHLLLYMDTLPRPFPVFVLAAGAIGAFLRYVLLLGNKRAGNLPETESRVHIEDIASGFALVFVLPIMLLVTKLETGYFVPRYAIGSALGVAVVSGLLLSHWKIRIPEIEAFIPAGVIYCITIAMLGFWQLGQTERSTGVQSDPVFLAAPPREPVVIADAVLFWPTWWYSTPDTRARLHYLSDLDYAASQPDFIPEYTLKLEQPYGAPMLDDYKVYLATHRQFLLFSARKPNLEWVINRLSGDGWHLNPIGSSSSSVLFQVEKP